MKTKYSKAILASYATFKELYSSQKYKSAYQILSEFIRYIITSKSFYSFTSTDIRGSLLDEFGFDLPTAVILNALQMIEGVGKSRGLYMVNQKVFVCSADFHITQQKSEENKSFLMQSLIEFANEKGVVLQNDMIERELLSFVLDEPGEERYQKIIGEFVLFNKDNKTIVDAISTIQEGGILYTGLTSNIAEFGQFAMPLTLFLDTEILFDISGLNGDLYKTLATDFLNLVNAANQNGKVITLKYFSEVFRDIDNYYDKAELVVQGRVDDSLNTAMKAIVKGCKDVSDIAVKRTDLYRLLSIELGINKDEKDSYYSSSDTEFNLEGQSLPGYPLDDQFNEEGLRYCSHINVLRKGVQTKDLLSSKFICVTDTKRVLDISRALTESQKNPVTGERYCDYAVSLNHITNLLWYKMNRGFGSTDFPRNLDAVIKARTVLAGYVSQGISTKYKEIKTKAATGELSSDQAAAYIVALKEKEVLPEALDPETVDNSLDFSTEYFNKFEETIAQNARLLKERDDTIRDLSKELDSLQDQLSKEKESSIKKQRQIDELAERIKHIEEIDANKSNRKRIMNSRLLLTWAILWKIMVVVGVVFVIHYICKALALDFGTWLSVGLGILGVLGFGYTIIMRDIKKHKERCKAFSDNLENDT